MEPESAPASARAEAQLSPEASAAPPASSQPEKPREHSDGGGVPATHTSSPTGTSGSGARAPSPARGAGSQPIPSMQSLVETRAHGTSSPSRATAFVLPPSSASPAPPSPSPPPPPPPPTLPDLPEDVFAHVLSFLAAKDVASASQTSRVLHQRCSDPSVWFRLFVQDFELHPADIGALHVSPYRAYVARIAARTKRLAHLADRRKSAAVSAKLRLKQTLLGLRLAVLNILTWTFTPLLSFLLLVIFAASKLDGDVAWSWAEVFSPIWVWLSLLFLSLVSVCTSYAGQDDASSFFYGQWGKMLWVPFAAVISTLPLHMSAKRRRLAFAHGIFTLLCFFLIPVMLVIKLDMLERGESAPLVASDSASSYPWAVVFLPVWLLGALLPAAIPLGWLHGTRADDAKSVYWILFVALFLPFFLTMVILAVSLDNGSYIPVHLIFIPFWVVGCILTLIMVIYFGWGVFRLIRHREAEDLGMFFSACLALCVALLPPFLTCLLAAVKLDTGYDLEWKRVFGAMIFWFLVATVVSWIATAGATSDLYLGPLSEMRASRRGGDPWGAEATMRDFERAAAAAHRLPRGGVVGAAPQHGGGLEDAV